MSPAEALRDVESRADIHLFVTDFYRRAFADALLGPIFVDIAKMDLARHMPIMCDFWETVLFRAGLYRRNALAIHSMLHAKVALEQEHFDRWLALWISTIDDHHAGPKAELAKLQATRIAGSIHRRLHGLPASEFVTIGTAPAREATPGHDG